MAKERFRVFNVAMGDHVAVVEMEESVFKSLLDDKVLDPNQMTLRGLKHGGQYTLIPVDDHTVATLLRVEEAYKTCTEKPARMFSTTIGRMDNLIEAVGLLFGKVKYTLIENKDDLQMVLTPHKDHEPKIVEYTVLGDMLEKAKAAAGLTDPDHKCGPGCDHGKKDEAENDDE
jgi:hypothetical protein